MSGVEALHEMRALRPDAMVILSSGYAEEDSLRELGREQPDAFLAKPYTAQALADVLRRVLDARARALS
ncbi:MAG: hypothetical protein QNK03_04625 [Myxococcota bacterium]|nr:hypothetical protein [Myxococcota bacterium]